MSGFMNARDEFEKWTVDHNVDITREKDHPEDYLDINTDKLHNCWVSACNQTLTMLNESLKKELRIS